MLESFHWIWLFELLYLRMHDAKCTFLFVKHTLLISATKSLLDMFLVLELLAAQVLSAQEKTTHANELQWIATWCLFFDWAEQAHTHNQLQVFHIYLGAQSRIAIPTLSPGMSREWLKSRTKLCSYVANVAYTCTVYIHVHTAHGHSYSTFRCT